MKRLLELCVVGLVLVGCGEDAGLVAARQRVEAAQAALREEEARGQDQATEVERLKARLREAESARAQEERELEGLRKRLVASWRGDAKTLKAHQEEAEVPTALRPLLEEAQKAMGGAALEQRFSQGLARKNLALTTAALKEWSSRDGVTPAPEETAEAPAAEEPEEEACTRVSGDFGCTVLPLGGSGDSVTQLCRLAGAGQPWVVRSEHGRLVRLPLVPGSAAHYGVARTLGPDVWVLRATDAGASAPGTLEVYEVSGAQAVRRHSRPLVRKGKPASLVEADLDADGLTETLMVGADEVEAIHREGLTGGVSLWSEYDVCPKLTGRSEPGLEPARAACTAWSKASQPAGTGAK
ncbi:hypothetical protein [Archangium sp.]|jgi:hypothetical protein|uniref:hypothetical protein n=1 Tax=Archangium sp. TaxID=1872627 RepID=UPI002ED84655